MISHLSIVGGQFRFIFCDIGYAQKQISIRQRNNLTNDTEERLTLLEEGLIHVSLLLLIRRKHASVHPIAVYPAGILLKELLEIIIDSQRSEAKASLMQMLLSVFFIEPVVLALKFPADVRNVIS